MSGEPLTANEVLQSDRDLMKGIQEMAARRFVQTSHAYLSASAVLVLTGLANTPQARAQSPVATAARPEFEVASIKPNTSANGAATFPYPFGGRITATNVNLKILIEFSYKVRNFEISGAPGWIDSDRYDVTAKAAESNIGVEQYQLMLQSLLADRFKLAVHRETKEMPVYAVLPAKGGPRLPEAKPGSCVTFGPDSPPPLRVPGQSSPLVCGGFSMGPYSLEGRKLSVAQLVNALSIILGRPVIDKTGFTGTFDIHLEFAPEGTTGRGQGGFGPPGLAADAGNPDTSRPSIFTALQDQLGLKLESQKGPADVLVIDHLERAPTEN
jgi:uncharacterized protein (TIGR03435 family)